MTPEAIGRSIIAALAVVLILVVVWPFLPLSGPFTEILRLIEASSVLLISAIVIGPLAVAYYLLNR
jgi:hypothetical protein